MYETRVSVTRVVATSNIITFTNAILYTIRI
jgi:hypothetical protein